MAHVDAGKTTVTEELLYHSGAIRSCGRVDHGTTVTDSMEIEQKRGMTVRSTTVSFNWQGCKINLIDTPGHVDFVAEVERSLSVVDGVVLVISAKEGVQPQTRVIFRKLQEMKMPVIFFINKVDRMGASVDQTLFDMQKQLTDKLLPVQRIEKVGERDCSLITAKDDEQLRDNVLEQLLMISEREDLIETYLAGKRIEKEKVRQEYQLAIANNLCYPVLMGAALMDVGIQELLDTITGSFASRDIQNKDACAYVYKVERGRHKSIYFRVLKGSITFKGRYRIVSGASETECEQITVSQLLRMEQGRREGVDFVGEGDIGVIYDLPGIRCGDYLIPAGIESPEYPEKRTFDLAQPLLKVSIEPRLPQKRRQLLSALFEMMDEDPLLAVHIHPDTAEISVNLFGKLQLDVLEQLLLERFDIQVDYSELSTTMREHPTVAAEVEVPFCAAPDFLAAGVSVRIEPLSIGEGIRYESEVSFGYLRKSFQNAVQEGVLFALKKGLTEQNEVTDVKVILTDAFYDSVTSTPADFRKLMPIAVHKALEMAEVELLEPWLSYELNAPVLYEKQAVYELTRMRGTLSNMEHDQDLMTITGTIPIDTSKSFADAFTKYTEGKGSFQTEFWKFLPCSNQ